MIPAYPYFLRLDDTSFTRARKLLGETPHSDCMLLLPHRDRSARRDGQATFIPTPTPTTTMLHALPKVGALEVRRASHAGI